MREIKFRAWHNGEMMYDVDLYSGKYKDDAYGYGDGDVHDDAPVMQYTGLKDKNGVEIYEGDVVSIGNGELIEEIKWIKEKQWMRGECPFSGFVNHDAIYKSGVQVIGNIYENPELISQK